MEQIAGVEWRVQNIRGHVANHLYVFDGDLAAEDAEAAEVVKLKGEIGERLTTLDALVPELDAENQARYATLVEKRQAYVAAYDQALKLSREETVAAAEDRSGSRTVYLEQVQPALDEFQDGMREFREGVAAEVDASADATGSKTTSGTLLIVAFGLAGLIATVLLSVLLARSITRPLGVLVDRLNMLGNRCVTDLRNALDAMAKGDLTQTVTPVTPLIESTAKDEIGQASNGPSTGSAPTPSRWSRPTTRPARRSPA